MITKMFKCRRSSSALRCGEEGSALIELALSLPLLSIILLGAAEFARLAYASIEVANAAHAGAMYASYSLAASADSGGISNAASGGLGKHGGRKRSLGNICYHRLHLRRYDLLPYELL